MPQQGSSARANSNKFQFPVSASKIRTETYRDRNGVVRTRVVPVGQASDQSFKASSSGGTQGQKGLRKRIPEQVLLGSDESRLQIPRQVSDVVTTVRSPSSKSSRVGQVPEPKAAGKFKYEVEVQGSKYLFHFDRVLSFEEQQDLGDAVKAGHGITSVRSRVVGPRQLSREQLLAASQASWRDRTKPKEKRRPELAAGRSTTIREHDRAWNQIEEDLRRERFSKMSGWDLFTEAIRGVQPKNRNAMKNFSDYQDLMDEMTDRMTNEGVKVGGEILGPIGSQIGGHAMGILAGMGPGTADSLVQMSKRSASGVSSYADKAPIGSKEWERDLGVMTMLVDPFLRIAGPVGRGVGRSMAKPVSRAVPAHLAKEIEKVIRIADGVNALYHKGRPTIAANPVQSHRVPTSPITFTTAPPSRSPRSADGKRRRTGNLKQSLAESAREQARAAIKSGIPEHQAFQAARRVLKWSLKALEDGKVASDSDIARVFDVEVGAPNTLKSEVSTRIPIASLGDNNRLLLSNFEDIDLDPLYETRLLDAMRLSHPALTSAQSLEEVVEFLTENLLFIHKNADPKSGSSLRIGIEERIESQTHGLKDMARLRTRWQPCWQFTLPLPSGILI